jgi:putative chitinase
MELTKEQLKQLLPNNPYVDDWHAALAQLLPDYEINTPQRIAAFIAQCAHEYAWFYSTQREFKLSCTNIEKVIQ